MLACFMLFFCLLGCTKSWCPDSNGVCTCIPGTCSEQQSTGTITCIIDGILPSLQPGNSTGQGTCWWRTVNLIINSIPALTSTIFHPGFAMCHLNIHQNSTDPIPFATEPLLGNVNRELYCQRMVTVTSLSGPLPFAAFDSPVPYMYLTFEGSFTIDQPLPQWKTPSNLYGLTLNSSVYSDLPWNVFENLQCQIFGIDIYNYSVIKSFMFNDIMVLQFCNVERIESFAINNSTVDVMMVDRGDNNSGTRPCRKSSSVSQIEAHAFHNTVIRRMVITVDADSKIQEKCFDTQKTELKHHTDLDLAIADPRNEGIHCGTIGNLTAFFSRLTINVGLPIPGFSVFNGLCEEENNQLELTIVYDGTCLDTECVVSMDTFPQFPMVSTLYLYGSDGFTLDLNVSAHFPNTSEVYYYQVCDNSLLTLPFQSTTVLINFNASAHIHPLHLVFRAPLLSKLKLWSVLDPTKPINCDCSISWMLQHRDCHSFNAESSVDDYLSNVQCSNQNGTAMQFLVFDGCCQSTAAPSPIPNCNGSHTLPPAVLSFDHRDLPQCRADSGWRFDPCDVESFYNNPLPARETTTTVHLSTPSSTRTASTTALSTAPSATTTQQGSTLQPSTRTSSTVNPETPTSTTAASSILTTASTTHYLSTLPSTPTMSTMNPETPSATSAASTILSTGLTKHHLSTLSSTHAISTITPETPSSTPAASSIPSTASTKHHLSTLSSTPAISTITPETPSSTTATSLIPSTASTKHHLSTLSSTPAISTINPETSSRATVVPSTPPTTATTQHFSTLPSASTSSTRSPETSSPSATTYSTPSTESTTGYASTLSSTHTSSTTSVEALSSSSLLHTTASTYSTTAGGIAGCRDFVDWCEQEENIIFGDPNRPNCARYYFVCADHQCHQLYCPALPMPTYFDTSTLSCQQDNACLHVPTTSASTAPQEKTTTPHTTPATASLTTTQEVIATTSTPSQTTIKTGTTSSTMIPTGPTETPTATIPVTSVATAATSSATDSTWATSTVATHTPIITTPAESTLPASTEATRPSTTTTTTALTSSKISSTTLYLTTTTTTTIPTASTMATHTPIVTTSAESTLPVSTEATRTSTPTATTEQTSAQISSTTLDLATTTTTTSPTTLTSNTTPDLTTTCDELASACRVQNNSILGDPSHAACSDHYFVCANGTCHHLYCPQYPVHTYFDPVTQACSEMQQCDHNATVPITRTTMQPTGSSESTTIQTPSPLTSTRSSSSTMETALPVTTSSPETRKPLTAAAATSTEAIQTETTFASSSSSMTSSSPAPTQTSRSPTTSVPSTSTRTPLSSTITKVSLSTKEITTAPSTSMPPTHTSAEPMSSTAVPNISTCNDLAAEFCKKHRHAVFGDPNHHACSKYFFVCSDYFCYKLYCPWFPIHTYFNQSTQNCERNDDCA